MEAEHAPASEYGLEPWSRGSPWNRWLPYADAIDAEAAASLASIQVSSRQLAAGCCCNCRVSRDLTLRHLLPPRRPAHLQEGLADVVVKRDMVPALRFWLNALHRCACAPPGRALTCFWVLPTSPSLRSSWPLLPSTPPPHTMCKDTLCCTSTR